MKTTNQQTLTKQITGSMKRLFLLANILIGLLLYLPSAAADEFWRFAQVTCIEELHYFSIRTFEIHAEDEIYDFLNHGKDIVKEKYNLINLERDTVANHSNIYECRLPDKVLKYQFESKDDSEAIRLKIWENKKLIVDIKSFSDQQYGMENIDFVSYTDRYYNQVRQAAIFISGHNPLEDRYRSKIGIIGYFELKFNLTKNKNRIIDFDVIRDTKNKDSLSYEPSF